MIGLLFNMIFSYEHDETTIVIVMTQLTLDQIIVMDCGVVLLGLPLELPFMWDHIILALLMVLECSQLYFGNLIKHMIDSCVVVLKFPGHLTVI